LLIPMLCLLVGAATGEHLRKERKVEQPILINARRYSDELNSSCLQVSGRLKGERVWRQKTGLDEPVPPTQFAIKDAFLIAVYPSRIIVMSRDSGQLSWSRGTLRNFFFDLKPEGMVDVDHAGYYGILGLDKKIVNKMSLPFVDTNTVLAFSRKLGDEMVYAYKTLPEPGEPGGSHLGPSFTFKRVNIKKDKFLWQFIREEDLLDVLFSEKDRRMCICTHRDAYLFLIDTISDAGVRSIHLEEIVSCALDHHGNLLLVGRQEKEKHLSLKQYTMQGVAGWNLAMEKLEFLRQPPASSPDGKIYILTGRMLRCIDKGHVSWSFELPSTLSLITVLKDGSILASSGSTLIQISHDGKEMLRVSIDENITTRPVMDENGHVYIGGVKGIYCFK